MDHSGDRSALGVMDQHHWRVFNQFALSANAPLQCFFPVVAFRYLPLAYVT